MPSDEPLVVVEVLNSTPEPDGSVHRFYLRVPPQFGNAGSKTTVAFAEGGEDRRSVARTPHAAIAWTFGLMPDEYRPEVMT